MIDEIQTLKKNEVIGVGVDVVELCRFRGLRWPKRIAELVLTPVEYDSYSVHSDASLYLASRFALKEAVIKAYPGNLTYHDFEIAKAGKKPFVKFLFAREQTPRMHVSLSHSTDYVAGFAIAV